MEEGKSREKGVLNVRVVQETLDAFNTFVERKHGKLWRKKGEEVGNALEFYMNTHEIESNPPENPTKGREKDWKKVYQKVKLEIGFRRKETEVERAQVETIKNAIAKVRGKQREWGKADLRTKKKWFKRFLEKGWIQDTGGIMLALARVEETEDGELKIIQEDSM